MGHSMPKPVESAVVETHTNASFSAAVAELNGWRSSMEDSHIIYMKENWGFFGVFDGHGGHLCSSFVAKTIRERLDKDGCPADDAAVKKLILSVDEDFLKTTQTSGCTGTMCIIHRPEPGSTKFRLRVVNIGDSRVILGFKNGNIFDGGGTDGALTTDHKPNEPTERERIYRCGGYVEHQLGSIARVNGNLAVSRSFGDRMYKTTGGPLPEDRPVTANPELGEFEADENNFLLLVCDGVSEGDFSNAEVVQCVAELFKGADDLGETARQVCLKAVDRESNDNVTCMIVTFDGGEESESVRFTPGQILDLSNKSYRMPYADMAQRAGLALPQAVERRYNLIKEELKKTPTDKSLLLEEAKLGEPAGEEGSPERAEWFAKWVDSVPDTKDEDFQTSALNKDDHSNSSNDAEKLDDFKWSQDECEITITFKVFFVERGRSLTRKEVNVIYPDNTSLKVFAAGLCLLDCSLAHEIVEEKCSWNVYNEGWNLCNEVNELRVTLTKVDAEEWETLIKS